jgi:hypothetical protein
VSRIPIRYLPWMLRDLLLAQGLVLLAISILIYVITIRINPAPPVAFGPVGVVNVVRQSSLVLVLLCTASIVSADRGLGYYRSIFSRPISPPLYYLQRWLLGALLMALVVPAYTLAFSLAIGRFPIEWSLVARVELFYLLLGGLIFLISTVLRSDWLLGLMVFMLHGALSAFRSSPSFHLPAFWEFVYRIFPPFHLIDAGAPPLSGSQLAHVLLYGAGFVLAALAMLQWRPLGAGGRA